MLISSATIGRSIGDADGLRLEDELAYGQAQLIEIERLGQHAIHSKAAGMVGEVRRCRQ
jgi:hypothetical protein